MEIGDGPLLAVKEKAWPLSILRHILQVEVSTQDSAAQLGSLRGREENLHTFRLGEIFAMFLVSARPARAGGHIGCGSDM